MELHTHTHDSEKSIFLFIHIAQMRDLGIREHLDLELDLSPSHKVECYPTQLLPSLLTRETRIVFKGIIKWIF